MQASRNRRRGDLLARLEAAERALVEAAKALKDVRVQLSPGGAGASSGGG